MAVHNKIGDSSYTLGRFSSVWGGTPIASNSDGDLFALFCGASANDLDIYVSTDDGSTWTKKHDSATDWNGNGSGITVSSDGYIFVMWQDTGLDVWTEMLEWNGSTLTSKATLQTFYADTRFFGDVVAHPLGTGWYMHYIMHDQTTDFRLVSVSITSGFTMTQHANTQIHADTTGTTPGGMNLDLVHNGDGMTLIGDPDMWVGHRSLSSTTTYRFYKVTYSSGPDAWAIGSVRTVSMNGNAGGGLVKMADAAFDGSDFIIHSVEAGVSTADQVGIWYRDNADTTTTTGSLSPAITSGDIEDYCVMAPHDGKVYVIVFNNADSKFYYNIYTKSGDSWDSWVEITLTGQGQNLASRRWGDGGTRNAFDIHWFDNTNDDYYHTEVVAINSLPTATITDPTTGTNQNIEDPLLLDWTYNDGDGDAQTKYSIRRVIDAVTTEYWNGTGWVGSESGATEISSADSSITFDTHWGDPSSETVHSYSVKVHDGTGFGSYSSAVAVYPTTTISTNRGFSLPRPYKKQENLNAVLKSNTDYMLSWINSYVPSYGDLNDDLYVKAGIRAGGESQMRDTFPPVVGEFDLGNGTNYFNAVGATNVYRTNELALSQKKSKHVFGDMLVKPRDMMREPRVKAFKYKDEKKNAGHEYRFGLIAEDVMRSLGDMGINPYDSPLIHKDKEGNLYLVENQLIYLLWHAVQELQAEVDDLQKNKNNNK